MNYCHSGRQQSKVVAGFTQPVHRQWWAGVEKILQHRRVVDSSEKNNSTLEVKCIFATATYQSCQCFEKRALSKKRNKLFKLQDKSIEEKRRHLAEFLKHRN